MILASRSSTRLELLASCGIRVEPVAADVDERAVEAEEIRRGALPGVVARRLAAQKALAVSRRSPTRL
ncbi:MAG: Maf family protein, partial [Beijerinckiaceae bacterium]